MPKGSKGKWAGLIRVFQGHRLTIGILFALMMLSAVLETVTLSLSIPLIAVVLQGGSAAGQGAQYVEWLLARLPQLSPIVVVLTLPVVFSFLKMAVDLVKTRMTSVLGWGLYEQWNGTLAKAYLYASQSWLVQQRHGALLASLGEPMAASKTVFSTLTLITTTIVTLVLYVGLVIAAWKIAIGLLVVGVAGVALMRWIPRQNSKALGEARLLATRQQGIESSEAMSSLRLIKTYGLEPRFLKRLQALAHQVRDVTVRYEFQSALPVPVSEFVTAAGIGLGVYTLYAIYGGRLAEVLPVLTFVLLVVRRLQGYVPSLISQWMGTRFNFAALANVAELVHTIPEERAHSTGAAITRLDTAIEFDRVTFAYVANRPVLRELTFQIPLGKTTAITGPSGSGKSTIADLLLGLIHPQQGAIRLNGTTLESFNISSWRSRIGYVTQETILLNDTIEENIRLGNPEASREQVQAAARSASLSTFIEQLPQGYQTTVGDRGVQLSGGQRQRVAIARALVRDPYVLIFDEATSSLDHETEKSVQQSIDALAGTKTIVIIAHRLSTIENAHHRIELQSASPAHGSPSIHV